MQLLHIIAIQIDGLEGGVDSPTIIAKQNAYTSPTSIGIGLSILELETHLGQVCMLEHGPLSL